jgi:sulfatase modifying factor 1
MENFSQALPGLSLPFEMVFVKGGVFQMGDEYGDLPDNCRVVNDVAVSNFYIGKHAVTQALWKSVMKGENPSRFQEDDHPVEQVSWEDITEKFLPELNHLTGFQFRLPTEAEWEYAARGGIHLKEGYKFAGSDRLKDVGWFSENSDGETKPVGLKSPNQLGIFDFSGNVDEWCEYEWHSPFDRMPNDSWIWIDSPQGGPIHVSRGGSWYFGSRGCRIAFRNDRDSSQRYDRLGFRLALSLQANGEPLSAFQ